MDGLANAPRVLLIDDNRDHLDLMRAQLGAGVCVMSAADGVSGYAMACTEKPDVIVLDVVMPVLDGWSVLRKLRNNPTTADVPIVMATGLDSETFAADANRLGVHAVLQKPYAVEDLRQAVQNAFKLRVRI